MIGVPPFDLDVVDRLLTTTKAVRRRLDLDRPVPRDVILECLRVASYAPNASNAQDWRWIGVDDPDQRRRVGEQYRKEVECRCTKMLASKESAGDEAGARITRSVLYLAQRMADVPVLVVPCYDIDAAAARYDRLLGAEGAPAEMTPAMFASILPAVWSFQLALRSRGLGSTLTTAHQEDQPAMARILGIPDGWYQVALIPCAYTTGGDFRPSHRDPVADTVIWNRFGVP